MLEAFDPASKASARTFATSLELSDAARGRLESGQNVRRYIDRLLGEGLAADGLVVIARALPAQLAVAWGCECLRLGLEASSPAIDAEKAGIALAEQCLKDPTPDNRQLCLQFAEGAHRQTASSWLATAAAWADGPLTPPSAPVKVEAPAQAVGEAVVAGLKLAAVRGGKSPTERLAMFATRALTVFGPRPPRPV